MQQLLIEKPFPQLNKNQQRKQIELPWFEEYLPPEFQGFALEYEIRKWRNRCILALIAQFCSSLTGMAFYAIRKVPYILFGNLLALILVLIGTNGVLKLIKFRIAVHGLITCSVLGAFFLYSLIELLFGRFNSDSDVSEKKMLIIFSLPYLIDFLSGCTTFYLAFYLYKKEQDQQNVLQELPPLNENNQNDLCIVCMTKQRDTFFYKCGHKVLCYGCSQQLKKKYQSVCPICRKDIEDIIKSYDV